MKRSLVIAAVAAALAAPAAAQTGSSATTAPHHHNAQQHAMMGADHMGQGNRGKLSASDWAFVKDAAIGGMMEVELGNTAKDKASNDAVKQFGDRMVTDHSKANDELKQWAEQNNVTLPTQLDQKHEATVSRLSKLSGDAFDKAYMRDMVQDHTQDVAKFKKASQNVQNADLKAWAAKTLPTLQDHLKLAKDTAAKVGANAMTKKTPKTPKKK